MRDIKTSLVWGSRAEEKHEGNNFLRGTTSTLEGCGGRDGKGGYHPVVVDAEFGSGYRINLGTLYYRACSTGPLHLFFNKKRDAKGVHDLVPGLTGL